MHEVLQPTDSPSLSIITSGPLPPTPAELLADVRLRAFIAEAETLFDVVILDGPPTAWASPTRPMIAAAVSGTIVVVESGRTGRAQIRSGLRRLRMGHAKILGAVLAKYDVRAAAYGYGYGYGSAYGYYAYEYGDDKKGKAPAANRLR